jgi:hypothetical protein
MEGEIDAGESHQSTKNWTDQLTCPYKPFVLSQYVKVGGEELAQDKLSPY